MYLTKNMFISPQMVDNFTHLYNPNDPYLHYLNPIYIYTLSDSEGIKYIGTTNDPCIRFGTHKCNARNNRDKTRRGQWIKSLLDTGIEPVMTVIEKCHLSIANERERYWVYHYHQSGYNLTNGLYKLD